MHDSAEEGFMFVGQVHLKDDRLLHLAYNYGGFLTDLFQICLLFVQTEENTVMKEALGRMKNSKEKNMCWQDGRLFDDKEDWVVDSCTKCTCQVVHSQEHMYQHIVDVCNVL